MEDIQEKTFTSRIDLTALNETVHKLRQEVAKIIVGQTGMVDLLLAAMLCDGHVLIEGAPGLAKTLTAKLMSRAMSTGFSRIQFTPDLMPSDVLGTSVFNTKSGDFEFRKGPLFSNIVLIDEINRAPAKTQSALFEVMEERQITVDGKTYKMEKPFIVIATQNPIEHEGTYRLPEAQLDRFLFKIEVGYPSLEDETQILASHYAQQDAALAQIQRVISGEMIGKYQEIIQKIHIEANLLKYIAQIVGSTRSHNAIYLGASPRASIAIMSGAKAFAAMDGRDFVTPEDIKRVAPAVLKHRILLTPEKEMEGSTTDDVVKMVIESIEIPR
jgi:MoxR-like ATPase